MAKQRITLNIAGESYPLNIDAEKEEIYRRAAREINNWLASLESQYDVGERHKALAITALQFSVKATELEMSRGLGREMEAVVEIDRKLNDYLNKL